MPATVTILVQQSSSGSAVADAKKDLSDIGGAAKDAGGGFSIMGEIATGALRAIGEAALGAAIGGLKALGGAISDGINDARQNAKIQAQTAAVIKSTGGAAGVSAQHIADYAASLSAASGVSLFGDDQIQESENLLLTFTNISGASLDAATAMSVDLAQAMGGAPKDSAIQLGKALNDPIKGITALTRIGVTFSDEQKDMIKAMQEGGDMAGAQAVILEELNKEFGGSAAAAAKADGGMAQFKDRIGEAKEAIGTALLPLLGQMAGFLNDTIAPAVETAAAAFSAWLANPATQAGIQALTEVISGALNTAMAFLSGTLIPALLAGWAALQPAIELVRGALGGMSATFSDSSTPVQGFLDVLSQISPTFALARGIIEAVLPPIQSIVMTVFGAISTFLAEHSTEITAFVATTWQTIGQIVDLTVQLIQATIVPIFMYIAEFLAAHGTEIQAILGGAWTMITSIIGGALELIKGVLTVALQLIKGDWQGAWTTIQTMCANVVLAILGVIKGFLEIAETLFSSAWQKILSDATAAFAVIKALFIFVWDSIKVYFQGLLDGLTGWVIQTFAAIGNAITGAGPALSGAAGKVGDAIIGGIVHGIESGVGAIISAAKDAAMAALDAAMHVLDAHSPSRKFMEIGQNISEGMAIGIAGNTPLVAGAAAGAAGAALAGGSSVADSYNRSMTYSPTYNSAANDPGQDYALLSSLAGV